MQWGQVLKLEKGGLAEIKELEKEIFPLNNHIHQAELSIKNYRVSLSEKSPRIGFSSSKECGIQTEPDDTIALQASLKAAQDKIQAALDEARSAKAAKNNFRRQLNEMKILW